MQAFKMQKTRKMRGGELYSGQLNAAAETATTLANQLAAIAKMLPEGPAPAPAAPAAPAPAPAPIVSESAPIVSESAPSVSESAPSVSESAPSVSEPIESAPSVSEPIESAPSVPEPIESSPSVSEPIEPSVSESSVSEPSVPASVEPTIMPQTPIPYGSGLSIPYGNIATILNNMINIPGTYNKKNIPNERLQSLLTQIKSAKTEVDVSNILRANNFNVFGKGVSKQYFSMSGGTKKRKIMRRMRTKRRNTMKKH